MRAAFHTAIDDSHDVLVRAVDALESMNREASPDPRLIAKWAELVGGAIASLEAMAHTWRAVEAVMDEVERDA